MKLQSFYNIQLMRVFHKYTYYKVFILCYVCSLLLIGVGIYLAFTSRELYLAYLLGGILLPVFMHVYYKFIEYDLVNRTAGIKKGIKQIFTFDELGFELNQVSIYQDFNESYRYSDVLSIIKYKCYYFIYINRSQAFVIKSEDYLEGNEEELDALFSKVKKEKFIVKRNSKKRSKKKSIEKTSV